MDYINPFKLLEIESLDKGEIRKAKRKILAQVELSDNGTILYESDELTKSDILRITADLDDQKKCNYHLNISSIPHLGDFLKNGDISFFESSMDYPLFDDASFLDFISPYFYKAFSKKYKQAYDNHDIYGLRILFKGEELINETQVDKLYKELYQAIKQEINDWQVLKKKLTENYDQKRLSEISTLIQKKVKISELNALPPYFQKIRNDYASAIRDISVAIFNNFFDSQAALDVMNIASELKVSNLTKSRIEKDTNEIQNIHTEREESARYEDQLQGQADFIVLVQNLIQNIDEGELSASKVKEIIQSNFDANSLEELPLTFEEVRNHVAISLRNLSVSCWNSFGSISLSLWLLKLGLTININDETSDLLHKAQSQLFDLRETQEQSVISALHEMNNAYRRVSQSSNQYIDSSKVQQVLKKLFSQSNIENMASFSSTAKKTILGELRPILRKLPVFYANSLVHKLELMVGNNQELNRILDTLRRIENKDKGCFGPIAILFAIAIFSAYFLLNDSVLPDSAANKTSIATPNQPSSYAPANKINDSNIPTDASRSPISKSPPTNQYKGNQLKNGASPLNACFGKGIYHETSSWLLVKNGNSTDVIACLVDAYSGRTIRNEYIQAGESFKMTKLPNGTYYLKVFYGKDWNPTKKNACGTNGAFEKDRRFSVSDNSADYLLVEDNGASYTYGEVTLYTVANGNMDSRGISEDQFFN